MVLFFAKCGGPGISDSGPRLLLLLWMKNWISNWNVQEMYKTNAKRKNKKHSRAGATLGQGCFYCQSLDWVGQPTPFVSQLSTMLQKLRIWCHRKKKGISLPPSWFYYIYLPQIGHGVNIEVNGNPNSPGPCKANVKKELKYDGDFVFNAIGGIFFKKKILHLFDLSSNVFCFFL